MIDLINIGTEIKAKRQFLGLSQTQFAYRVGMTWRSISNFERGRNKPKLKIFYPIYTVLPLSIDELLNVQLQNKNYTNQLIQQFEIFSDDFLFLLSKCLKEIPERCQKEE